jgi:hypothetical protein
VYSNSFNPCDALTFVERLCPVPSGQFSARGSQDIPPEYANSVPAIAFQVPDIAAQAKLELKSLDDDAVVGCVTSQVSNGKTANVPAVSYIAAGIAGAALLIGGASAIGAAMSGGSAGGAGTMSPSFTEMAGVFQGFAMNGMMSVNHPPVYRSFSKNFAFSTGIVPWTQMQITIDDFRGATGGNLSQDSIQFLRNATLVYPDGSTVQPGAPSVKRSLQHLGQLIARQIETSINGTEGAPEGEQGGIQTAVSGIEGWVEQLSVPSSNTFMTVFLIAAIVIAAIIVLMLLVKVVLEGWALFGSFPQGLAGFRKHYWGSIARTITSLILVLYGIWVLYCIFQFTHGDSWAAKLIAGISLALFTGVLAFFTWKIWHMARKLKNSEGDASGLYDDKSVWTKYSLFYDSYKKSYWWLFVPVIAYMFAKGVILASTDGKGLVQAIATLVVEALMLGLLLWGRPYERKSGNVINIAIQVVRVLSVVCILFFVEEFAIGETAQTVTGVVLIAIQSALTGILAILIIWNGINIWCKDNPHRKRRKELEKMQRDMDTLTPLDARNSLLMERQKQDGSTTFSMSNAVSDRKLSMQSRSDSPDRFQPNSGNPYSSLSTSGNGFGKPFSPSTPFGADPDRESLVPHAAPIGGQYPSSGGYNRNSYNQGGFGTYRGY